MAADNNDDNHATQQTNIHTQAGEEACWALDTLCSMGSIDTMLSNFLLPLQVLNRFLGGRGAYVLTFAVVASKGSIFPFIEWHFLNTYLQNAHHTTTGAGRRAFARALQVRRHFDLTPCDPFARSFFPFCNVESPSSLRFFFAN